MKSHIKTGRVGESLALSYLKNKGYKILETNYKNLIGEVDIIAKQKDCIVFIEVKTSASLKYGQPRERINFYKVKKIKNVATLYLKQKLLFNKVAVRFDCIEVIGDTLNFEIEHLENAF